VGFQRFVERNAPIDYLPGARIRHRSGKRLRADVPSGQPHSPEDSITASRGAF